MTLVRPLSADERAELLVRQRDEFLATLPRRVPRAARLSHADRELIVDMAMSYVAVEHTDPPLESADDVMRVFWASCELRARRAHEGRYDTVRGGFVRVDDDELLQTSGGVDPASAVEEAEERKLVAEFAASLGERERRVLSVKFQSGTAQPLGYKKIAHRLRISLAAARSADRAIDRQLHAFAAIYAAGQLCPARETDIRALAEAAADPAQTQLALAHVAHCAHCNAAFVAQARVFRSAAFQRKIAAALPVVEERERRRLGGAWDAVVDWVSRPFGHDSVTTAAQLASSGAGRGIGTVALIKIAGACLASATAVTVCTTAVLPALSEKPPARLAPAKPAPHQREKPVGTHQRADTKAEQHLTPTVTPTPRANARTEVQRSRRTAQSGGSSAQPNASPSAHEATPASPAPANAAAGGESEFDPSYQPSSPPQPAPAPTASGGGNEFF